MYSPFKDERELRGLFELMSGGYPLGKPLVIIDPEEGPVVCAFFADLELDVFRVDYGGEDDITLHAKDVTNILATRSLLHEIAAIADSAERLHRRLWRCFNRSKDAWNDEALAKLVTVPVIRTEAEAVAP